MSDDQETRALPAPEPPPESKPRARSEAPATRAPEPARTRLAPESTRPADPVKPVDPVDPSVPEPEAPEAEAANTDASLEAPAQPSPESRRNTCLDACRRTLATCVSSTADGDGALERCKVAFDACKVGCQSTSPSE